MKPLHALGLAEAAEAVALGRVRAESLARALLARTRALEPGVQAWAWLDEAALLQAARRADATLRHAEGASDDPGAALSRPERGLLTGVPVGVKDLIDVAGMPTGMGSPVYAGYRPVHSAAIVERLARSGAIVMGKTVTTEFAFMAPSCTRNPWNTAHTPGGSSSGSAAAVACGMVPAAIGTQTNGSVIRPAAFCGVVGFKPGAGQVPTGGVLPFSTTFDTPGVFARSVADAALLVSWLTTAEADIAHMPSVLRTVPSFIAVRTAAWHKASRVQRGRFAADLKTLRAAGARVDERELPPAFDDAWRLHRLIMLHEAARAARPVRARWGHQFSAALNAALDEGDTIDRSTWRKALRARAELILRFGDFLDDGHAAVLTVPATGEAPEGLGTTGDPAFCSLWSLLGVPAISLPTGLGPRGLPMGLQVVSRPWESNYLLATAAWCEARLPFESLLQRETRKPSRAAPGAGA